MRAVPSRGRLCRAAWSLDASLILAPGSGESVLEASRRIDGICRWAYLQMDRKRATGLRQASWRGVRMTGAPAWDFKGGVACP
jgi:hypothetical protein